MNKMVLIVDEMGMTGAALEELGLDEADTSVLAIGSDELAADVSRSVDDVRWIDTKGAPTEAWASAAGDVIVENAPAAVVGVSSPGVRSIMGNVAVRLGAPLITGAISVKIDDDMAKIDRLTIDNRLIETIQAPTTVCLLTTAFEPVPSQLDPREDRIEQITVDAELLPIEDAGIEHVAGSHLVGAERVVCAGRGVKEQEDLAMVEELAGVLNAEVGCSMPLADERGWLPRESHIGWSGAHISPKLYIGLGVSGAYQHVFGIRNAQAIVCINSDPRAPFFHNSDYGIVGDIYEIVPELIKALG